MGKKACVIMIFVFCLALFGCAAVINESSSTVSSSDSSLVSSASSSQVTSLPSSETVSSQPSSSSSAVNSLPSKSSSCIKTNNKLIDAYIETAFSTNTGSIYNVPNIKGIDSPYVREVNTELNKLIEEFKEDEEYYKKTKCIKGSEKTQEENLIYLNGDVLSLVVHGAYNGGLRWYYVYNINITTGNKVTNSDILKSQNVSEKEYVKKLKETAKEHFKKLFSYSNQLYTVEKYNGYVNETSDYCSIETPLFLDENGNMNAVIEYCSLAGPTINYDIVGIEVAGK